MSNGSEDHLPEVLYSCNTDIKRESEKFLSKHAFTHIFEGSLAIDTGASKELYQAGDTILVKRNQLVRSVKYPGTSGQMRSITVFFSQERLRDFALTDAPKAVTPYVGKSVVPLRRDPLYAAYATSLVPYESSASQSLDAITALKTHEAVLLVLQLDPALRAMLFDFSEPGKIDLEAYMKQHFAFNVELKRFAYLTGRSIATFKRDFEKVFHTSPSRWLLQKRLEEAHYQIKEKGRKPSDVYLEVGFEDLSHFSFAFKKTYGVAPSLV
ncbi:helix-turn-helix domain-containing protein [Parachryseolinea silvisoli]|uniref:helix-turn-helix domain-containing protein n=1 Tax=Parachryseolinea silvisoli TaxID=2873601 RepID=UPI0022657FF6|nr:AraC family transcriptional regulator [Parachryseolinea silvisoli]MCD9015791.1 AraC family transcriptional regulator [Parachryseolinea silvisoli]